MGAIQSVCTDNFLEEVERLVVHNGNVVAIPTNGTRHVEHQFGHEQEQRSHHVAHVFRLLVMSRIERVHQFPCSTVAGHKVVRTNGIGLQPDAEELRFEAGLHVRQVFLQNLVEALGKDFAITFPLDRKVLRTVVNPDVHDGGVALLAAHIIGNTTATFGVLYPELADRGVGVAERQVAALGMRKACAVEVELETLFLRPLYPTVEMFRLDLVPIDKLATEVAINLVEVKSVITCEKALRKSHIGTHLIDVAGTTRIVTRRLDSTTQGFIPFEAHHIIRLPAMQADRRFFQLSDGKVGIDSDSRIALFCNLVRL